MIIDFNSWGFSRSCCEIFPTNAEMNADPQIVSNDINYFALKQIHNRSSVYVYAPDLQVFLKAFSNLPRSHRITVAIGMQDIGSPFQIFKPPRGNLLRDFLTYLHAPWQIIDMIPQQSEFTMRKFLNDERLHRLFVQNYDLVGCNPINRLCSDVSKQEAAVYERKVYPIPIGLDLHTFAGKGDMERLEFQHKVCAQRKLIREIQLRAPPFMVKRMAMVVAFDCNFDKKVTFRVRGRREVCDLVALHDDNSSLVIMSKKDEDGRSSFWDALQHNTFSLAPFGMGLDTHRLWEILHLRSIPIVLSSSMDRLYVNYPIVIVRSWAEAFMPGSLTAYKRDIVSRFGPEPFTADVVHRLSLKYWVDQVQASTRDGASWLCSHFNQSKEDLSAHRAHRAIIFCHGQLNDDLSSSDQPLKIVANYTVSSLHFSHQQKSLKPPELLFSVRCWRFGVAFILNKVNFSAWCRPVCVCWKSCWA